MAEATHAHNSKKIGRLRYFLQFIFFLEKLYEFMTKKRLAK